MKRVNAPSPRNLYVHFPFCRSKCAYCALFSRAGASDEDRDNYVKILERAIKPLPGPFKTVYFGGGSPALCRLPSLLEILLPKLDEDYEFTVELHPKDVTPKLLNLLRSGGVNRISMGVQSLNDETLSDMARGYVFEEAEAAFRSVRSFFNNAGIDLIAGYPGDVWNDERFERLLSWGFAHCSVYSLQFEENSALYRRKNVKLLDDDALMDRLSLFSQKLLAGGYKRYEISNYALDGMECRHNLAVWRGEDYLGIGAGAYGREGLLRTRNRGLPPEGFLGQNAETEKVTEKFDFNERNLFRLRTAEGIEARRFPEWAAKLDGLTSSGCVEHDRGFYRLTQRGFEICDSILASLV